MKPSIYAQMNKKNHVLDDWQVVVERVVDAKAKLAQQAPLLARESNTCYPHGYRLWYNKESKDQKDSEGKKPNPSTNDNSRSEKKD